MLGLAATSQATCMVLPTAACDDGLLQSGRLDRPRIADAPRCPDVPDGTMDHARRRVQKLQGVVT